MEGIMRILVTAIAGSVVILVLVMLLERQQSMAQQPRDYIDISQTDFEKIDDIARKTLDPLKEGDIETFGKDLPKHMGNLLLDDRDVVVGCASLCHERLGKCRGVTYVDHLSVSNVKDYYVFHYASMHEVSMAGWEFVFYKTGEEWKIVGLRCEVDNPVEFFEFRELQYESFAK
jgi:hypothetical protein